MKAVIIPADADTPVRVEEVEKINLAFLQRQVGGYIEPVDVKLPGSAEEASIYLDEEGKLKGKPYNRRATELAQDFLSPWDVIVGDAVVTGGVDEEGYTTGLTDEQVALLTQ